jgi:hypothetical protein
MIRSSSLSIIIGLSVAAFVASRVAAEESFTEDAARLTALNPRIQLSLVKVSQAFNAFYVVTGQRSFYNVIDPDSDRPNTELLSTYRNLYFAASFTKGVSEIVCTEKATKRLCTTKFDPEWLVYPKDANPTPDLLDEWLLETETVLEPLWTGLCDLAANKTGNQAYCELP